VAADAEQQVALVQRALEVGARQVGEPLVVFAERLDARAPGEAAAYAGRVREPGQLLAEPP
jgi:hypothetical protein